MIQRKIAIAGHQCAGKTEICKILCNTAELPSIIKFAYPIYLVLAALKKPKHRKFMQDFGEMAKVHFGLQIFADLFEQRVNDSCNRFYDLIICDDVRRDFEAERVLKCGFKLIYVDADRDIRKARAEAQELEFIEEHISEIQVPLLKNRALATIVNNDDDIHSLSAKVESTLKYIIQ